MQVQKRSRKVDGWVVDKFHNINEQDSGFTSTLTSMSPSKYQHFNGPHVTKVKSAEKDGQLPSMHTDLGKPRLKQLQAPTPNCNMASSVKMQLQF